jgi:FKBP-type peptidyl-prolyl cis-trans isomerase
MQKMQQTHKTSLLHDPGHPRLDRCHAKDGEHTQNLKKQVIPGWTAAMQKMVKGDRWEMYIPSDLAYGARGYPPTIPGGNLLVFQMEIMEIKGATKPKEEL